MADLPKLARVGDSVECDVRHPYPRTIRMILETPAAAAHANDLLMDPASGWRLVSHAGVALPADPTPEVLRLFDPHLTMTAISRYRELQRLASGVQPSQAPSRDQITAMVDAAMVEMSNIHPPLRRSECERLIRAALGVALPRVMGTPVPQITREQLTRWHDYMAWLMQKAGIERSDVIAEIFRASHAAPSGVLASDGKTVDR